MTRREAIRPAIFLLIATAAIIWAFKHTESDVSCTQVNYVTTCQFK